MTKNKKSQKLKLNKEELVMEKALAKGDYVSASDLKESKKMFQEAAETFLELKKSKRITIRINQADLIKVKAKAKKSGIPYQTLLRLFIHKYAGSKTTVSI